MHNFQINCPHCHQQIDIENTLSAQVESALRNEMQSKINSQQSELDKIKNSLEKERLDFEEKKRNENLLFQERLNKALSDERKILAAEQKKQFEFEYEERYKKMQNELQEKSDKIKELNTAKADIEILKRKNAEMEESFKAESEKKINEIISLEKERIQKQSDERNELRFRDMQKKLDDQIRLTEEMKRKQEQGSMQLQGEVQELAIEEWLRTQFPFDQVEEIKKGARGGDCIQHILDRSQKICGSIYYESKRTKEFQANWIEKFKADIREKGADIGVLVTDAMPNDMERMGQKEGIWICRFEEFKALSAVLREQVLAVSAAIQAQENKGDKMHLLYDFLTGNQFRMQVEGIVEGFTYMKNALENEKRSMQRIWKEREKQIDKVLSNTIDMYGSVRGIAGNAVQSVKMLELSPDDETETDE